MLKDFIIDLLIPERTSLIDIYSYCFSPTANVLSTLSTLLAKLTIFGLSYYLKCYIFSIYPSKWVLNE